MACLYEKAFMAFGLGKIKSVDSYKEMCKLLDEPDQTYHADLKKRQLEMWKLCFFWSMRKNKFTNIKLYSSEEYLYNILKKKYYNTAFYSLCALLNQYGKTSDKQYLLATKSELAVALGFYNEDFKAARFGKKTKLVEIENDALERYGANYEYLKPYKEEIRSKKNVNDITLTTVKAFEDFSSHQNKNINNQIESLLKEMEHMRIIYVQKERIGGFIDQNFLKLYNVDLDKIYQKDGNFYYDAIDKNSNQKISLLVPYEERFLTSSEIATQLNIDGKAIMSLNCSDFNEVISSFSTKQKFNEMVSYEYKHILNALFIYDTYKITFDRFFMAHSQEIFLKRNQDLFTLTSVKNSLELNNATSKDNSIENKKNRQSKETVNKRFSLGEKINEEKKKQLENLQKTELYLNRAFNKSFIDLNMEKVFPKNSNLFNLEDFQYATWSKLFSRSDKKFENTYKLEEQFIKSKDKLQNNCHQSEILSEDKIVCEPLNTDSSTVSHSQTQVDALTQIEIYKEISSFNYLCSSIDSLQYLNFLIDYLEEKNSKEKVKKNSTSKRKKSSSRKKST